MTSKTATAPSAERWGPIWGARPQEWAGLEEKQRPIYEEVTSRMDLRGRSVLDIGCGTGAFLRLAADSGAEPYGLDASERLLEVARGRVPEAELMLGSMEALPYGDDSFDVVTGFNSFFFADDMVAALSEARRVARAGARVVIQVWGRPEACDLTAVKQALAPFMPPPPPAAAAAPPLWQPGVLQDIAALAGLAPEETFNARTPLEYGGTDELAREMLSPANVTIALRRADEAVVLDALLRALEPYRLPGGRYRLENEWIFLTARA